MAYKYLGLNVINPPKNVKYIPVLKYKIEKDEAGNALYNTEKKSIIPKKIEEGKYGSITLSNGQKLLYFTSEEAGPITYLLLSNGEVYSDAWLFSHVDYVEKKLIDSSNNPLNIIKRLTSDEDIAKVKELAKKLDFDHFYKIGYDASTNSVTLDLNEVTPYQGEDRMQPQKDKNGNWYLPKTDNAYGELGIGYAQPYTYDPANGHSTILSPEFETATDIDGLKYVCAKKPAEVYPNAVSGDIYPFLPAKKEYTGKYISYRFVPHALPTTLKGIRLKETNLYLQDDENVCWVGNGSESEENAKKDKESIVDDFNHGKVHILRVNKKINTNTDICDLNAGETIKIYYSAENYSIDSLKISLKKYNPLFDMSINTCNIAFGLTYENGQYLPMNGEKTYEVSFTLKEKIPTSFNGVKECALYIKNNIPYREKECIMYSLWPEYTVNSLGTDKNIAWHNVMSYDGSSWTPKDFMSSITKTYTLTNGTATEKTDGTGTFYKFDDTMYPFSNSDIADIACGKNFTVFLLKDGSVWTCGANYHGQLGKGVDADKDELQISPKPIDVGSFTSILAKEQTWIALGDNGVLYACGANTFGQMGLGDKKDRSILTPIADNVERVQLTAGNIIIRKADGTVYGAGYNYDDRLGLNVCKCITKFTEVE